MTKIYTVGRKCENHELIVFPDGQPHVNLVGAFDGPLDTTIINAHITSPKDLFELCLLVNAIKTHRDGKNINLNILYLMGARYDRNMKKGLEDSFDLKVVSNIINSLGFNSVSILDPHSDTSLALIENSRAYDAHDQMSNVFMGYSKDRVLVVPDAGAFKKSNQYKETYNCEDSILCLKERSVVDGSLKTKVIDPCKAEGKDVIIVDDICDGGRTFINIAEEIKGKGVKPKSMTLAVTHGIFSQSIYVFKGFFDHIITTDSYYEWGEIDGEREDSYKETKFHIINL